MAKAALINYYAKLIKKKNYSIENVPEDIRSIVMEKVKTLPDPEFDPETETPAEGQEVTIQEGVSPVMVTKEMIGLGSDI